MVLWLSRQEKITWFETYLTWACSTPSRSPNSTPEVSAMDRVIPTELAMEHAPSATATVTSLGPLSSQEPAVHITLSNNEYHSLDAPAVGNDDRVEEMEPVLDNEDEVVAVEVADEGRGMIAALSAKVSTQHFNLRNKCSHSLTLTAISLASFPSTTLHISQGQLTIARSPHLGYLLPRELRGTFGCQQFTRALSAFICREWPSADMDTLEDQLPAAVYPVYSQFHREIRSIPGMPCASMKTTVFTLPGEDKKPSAFSTVVFEEDSESASHVGVKELAKFAPYSPSLIIFVARLP
ncbi:hypothetical protein OF83DRAFT_1171607 [Amylostereum chailletii]|nr:hypothetical protein OF83DRAFT_1171607 [Amylostereum chailletii]